MIKTIFSILCFATSLYSMQQYHNYILTLKFHRNNNSSNPEAKIKHGALRAAMFLSTEEKAKFINFLSEKTRVLKNLFRSNAYIHYSQLFFFRAASLTYNQGLLIDELNNILHEELQKAHLYEHELELRNNYLDDLDIMISGRSKDNSILCNIKLLNNYIQAIQNSSMSSYDTRNTKKYPTKNDVMRETIEENKKFF